MAQQGLFKRLFGFLASPTPESKDVLQVAETTPGEPYVDYNQAVVGEAYCQENLLSLAGGYARYQQRLPFTATLVREPTNPHDNNAIRVEINGLLVGYLPARIAARFAPDAKRPVELNATVPAIITGGWRTNQHDTGHFGVRIAL